MIYDEPACPEWQGWDRPTCRRQDSEPPSRHDFWFAAVYQRHDFLTERREALETWGAHVSRITGNAFEANVLRRVA